MGPHDHDHDHDHEHGDGHDHGAEHDPASRWRALLAPYGAPAALVDAALAGIAARHAELARRYHTLEHVAEVLDVVDDLADLADDATAVRLAAWLHDVVYDPTAPAGSNEAASAAFAARMLPSLGVPTATVATTVRLIELTAGHAPAAADPDGAVLADADLAILGSVPERYRRYRDDVRAEYAHVPDDAWRTGRAAVLRDFLDRPRLYRTDPAHTRFDAPARANLTAELSTLVL